MIPLLHAIHTLLHLPKVSTGEAAAEKDCKDPCQQQRNGDCPQLCVDDGSSDEGRRDRRTDEHQAGLFW